MAVQKRLESLWAEVLADHDFCERITRTWIASLRVLFPSMDIVDIAARFHEPWQLVIRRQLDLSAFAEELAIPAADLRGWLALPQSLLLAVGNEDGAAFDRLAVALSESLLAAVPSEPAENLLPFPDARGIRHDTRSLRDPPQSSTRKGGLVGSSQALRELAQQCASAARDRHPVLVSGETGSGKELAARLIHQLSGCRGSFVPVNCAALSESLVESELFGHVRGAFTGATTIRHGLFRESDGGTIFLDEITEIPLERQAKLLRVLQDGLVRPVGSSHHEKVEVRCTASTNRELREALDQGHLRRDLYYRLSVHMIRVPPLREHAEDIPELTAAFLKRWQRESKLPTPTFDHAALAFLQVQRWPGNVRQLENAVFRLASRWPGDNLTLEHVASAIDKGVDRVAPSTPNSATDGNLKDMERRMVHQALASSEGNKAAAARILGISRKTLYEKIRRYKIVERGDP